MADTDRRLRVDQRANRRGGRDWIDVYCSSCGTRLVCGIVSDHDPTSALRLAAANATARQCCQAWKENTDGIPDQPAPARPTE